MVMFTNKTMNNMKHTRSQAPTVGNHKFRVSLANFTMFHYLTATIYNQYFSLIAHSYHITMSPPISLHPITSSIPELPRHLTLILVLHLPFTISDQIVLNLESSFLFTSLFAISKSLVQCQKISFESSTELSQYI